jgi:hypothetical protein
MKTVERQPIPAETILLAVIAAAVAAILGLKQRSKRVHNRATN